MRVAQIAVVFKRLSYCFFRALVVAAAGAENGVYRAHDVFGHSVLAFFLQVVHHLAHELIGISARNEKQALGIEAAVDIVNAALEEVGEHAVFIRSADKAADRQTHLARIVGGEDVAEISRRDDEVYPVARRYFALLEHIAVSGKIIDYLRHEAPPVNGVRGRKSHAVLGELFAYLFVGEYRLDSGLCVVEVALYRADGDIAALLRGHLELLHGADALIGIEHENFRALNILEALESRLARVARGGDKNDGFARADGFPDGGSI